MGDGLDSDRHTPWTFCIASTTSKASSRRFARPKILIRSEKVAPVKERAFRAEIRSKTRFPVSASPSRAQTLRIVAMQSRAMKYCSLWRL